MTAALRAVNDVAISLDEAIASYIATLSHPESQGTRKQYSATLARLCRDIGPDRDVTSVTQAELADWMQATHSGNAPKTWNRARNCLRACWNHFAEQGYVYRQDERWPASWPVRPRKEQRQRSHAIPGRAFASLLADEKVPLRELTLWWMLYETGARASEILRLNVEDLDLGNQRAPVIRKGGAPDTVVWGDMTSRLLPPLLGSLGFAPGAVGCGFESRQGSGPVAQTGRAAEPGAPLFRSRAGLHLSYRQAEDIFTEWTAKLDGGPYTLHQIRHRRLVDEAEQGASQAMLKARSGHESDRSVQIYARVSTDALQAWSRKQGPPAWLSGQ